MKLGIIGGSGLYDMDGFKGTRKIRVDTPFGQPSDEIMAGRLEGVETFFLPRHGRGHRILPGELNHRANIYAMKLLGVTHIVSISAVGSLREELRPRDVVIVDQYVDRTKCVDAHTFFGEGIVAHIAFADPVCPELAKLAFKAAQDAAGKVKTKSKSARPKIHFGGTYVNMEGPAFSTKAESKLYRSWGMDVIGMTNLAEAKLAREAEICYCTAAMVTDYDCWHPEHDHVTVDMIIQNLMANVSLAKEIIRQVAAGHKGLKRKCACPSALSCAIITARDAIPEKAKERLRPIIGKYVK